VGIRFEHWSKFRPETLLLHEFQSWLIVLRQKQVTLGSAVILLKRPVPTMAEVTSGEFGELAEVFGAYEKRIKDIWAPNRFNYVVAMMKDPWVHVHAFPRYEKAVSAHGAEWKDDDWPRAIVMRDVHTDAKTIEELVARICW
jgi:diadenosine tetraphosphate (Ap4A) HIT family hydrolase